MRIAVVGHVEHVTLGRVDAVPLAGDIAHLAEPRFLPGGGGGIAFAQLAKSDAELHLFTAIGEDDAGRRVRDRLARAAGRIHVHAALRAEPHPHVVVLVDAQGRRTIVVASPPLQTRGDDPLPWDILQGCDAVYFTGSDAATLRHARRAVRLVVTARRAHLLHEAGVCADVVVGSTADPRENAPLASYEPQPAALVLTDGPREIRVCRADGESRVAAPPRAPTVVSDYGAGDSFAGAITYFIARGFRVEDACAAAGPFGAAVVAGVDPMLNQRGLG